jgi:hypothetical protein
MTAPPPAEPRDAEARDAAVLESDAPAPSPRRRRLHAVIFGTDTPAGRAFDVALIALIVASVAA